MEEITSGSAVPWWVVHARLSSTNNDLRRVAGGPLQPPEKARALGGHILETSRLHRMCLATVALSSLGTLAQYTAAQNPPGQKIDVMIVPDITIQTEDYADAPKKFHTKLLREGPAPHQDCKTSKPPVGVSEIDFSSSALRLRAWLGSPSTQDKHKYPAVLFLHGGFCFDLSDWQETEAFREAGFIVMLPNRRGENGQSGNFTMFYDEVEDVISAAEYLRTQPNIDQTRLYVAGSSTGGTLNDAGSIGVPSFSRCRVVFRVSRCRWVHKARTSHRGSSRRSEQLCQLRREA